VQLKVMTACHMTLTCVLTAWKPGSAVAIQAYVVTGTTLLMFCMLQYNVLSGDK